MAQLEEVGKAIRSVAERAGPAVVRIGGSWRGGLGVVISDGVVLTNAHNVRREAVQVAYADGRRADAQPAGVDVDGDLATLTTETQGVTPPDWFEGPIELGLPVFGVGFDGGGGVRVTAGFVSSASAAFRGPRGRRISGTIEHTAPLAPGSSGGPLVDATGRLVGINTNRLGDGFYLALPADAALRDRVAALARGESVERPRLGVGVAPSSVARRLRRAVGLPEADGVLVREVEEGSAAERAGIRQGDLIVGAGGRPVQDPDDLHDALAAASGTVNVAVLRGAESLELEVDFAAAD